MDTCLHVPYSTEMRPSHGIPGVLDRHVLVCFTETSPLTAFDQLLVALCDVVIILVLDVCAALEVRSTASGEEVSWSSLVFHSVQSVNAVLQINGTF
jgi:hypothetical protein